VIKVVIKRRTLERVIRRKRRKKKRKTIRKLKKVARTKPPPLPRVERRKTLVKKKLPPLPLVVTRKKKKDEKKAEKKTEKAPASAAAPSTEDDSAANEDGAEVGGRKRGPFRRFFYRGHEVPTLLDLSHAELMKLMTSRARRRFARGHVPMNLIRRLRKAKKDAPEGDKPKTVKTHLRNMIIVPEMVASVVGVYNGQSFTQVEIKPDMIGHYLGEFSISYKPVKHGRPGVGATNSSRFIPLK